MNSLGETKGTDGTRGTGGMADFRNEAVKRESAPRPTEKRSMRKSKRSMKKRHAVHAQNKTLHDRKNGAARKWAFYFFDLRLLSLRFCLL